MMVSTKGRYALQVMLYLADNNDGGYVPLKDIAEREEISQKYLESIMTVLSKAGMVDALHGKGGGYRLNRDPDEYTVASVLRVAEGNLAPVSCVESEGASCEKSDSCRTLPIWLKLNEMINDYFEGITVGEIARSTAAAVK
jgi:Rrf2 family protein